MNEKRISTKKIVLIGMFAAILAILSQFSIPTPFGVPITLQTFGVAMIGVILGWKMGSMTVLVYILLGAVGVPVFSNMNGGVAYLLGKTGGFIWGFLIFVILCGVGTSLSNKKIGFLLSIIGLLLCHLSGNLQFSMLANIKIVESFKILSILYLPKDILSVILAIVVGKHMKLLLQRSQGYN